MGSSGLNDSAKAIRERVGPDARYAVFVPPRGHDDTKPLRAPRVGRLLWLISLVLLVIVLILAALVVLGL